jgi:hypothetical protein
VIMMNKVPIMTGLIFQLIANQVLSYNLLLKYKTDELNNMSRTHLQNSE